MTDSNDENIKSKSKKLLNKSFIEGNGISDIDEKRQYAKEKRKIKLIYDTNEKEQIINQIKQGITLSLNYKDILLYLLLQLIPLLALASTMFVPSLIYLNKALDIRGVLIILLVLGSFLYMFGLLRTISAFSYKIEISETNLKWRSIFWWNSIENINLIDSKPIGSYYLYLIRIRGILRFGIEVINVVSKDKEYWIRTYPFYKKKAYHLAKIIDSWIGLTKITNE